jgi:hypothetical protein
MPQINPDEASTVFAQSVYSKVSFSSVSQSFPSSVKNFPLKIYIAYEGGSQST